jgi:hypothetical protein
LTPPLRTLLDRFLVHPLASKIESCAEEFEQAHKPTPDQRVVPVMTPSWVTQVSLWYDCPEEEVTDFYSRFPLLEVGIFYEHPFWMKMALRDYN